MEKTGDKMIVIRNIAERYIRNHWFPEIKMRPRTCATRILLSEGEKSRRRIYKNKYNTMNRTKIRKEETLVKIFFKEVMEL
jgi:hypothetical protein